MKKTDNEISTECARLRKAKSQVKPISVFGDDNHGQIEATLHMLETGFSVDDECIRTSEEFRSALEEAKAWALGELVEFSPAESWE